MRVLLVVHAFPPRSTAGVEVYTLRLAHGLASLGHEVRVLTAVHDLAATPYETRDRVHEGIPVTEVVSVHARGTLAATYDDPAIVSAAGPLLSEFRPECVHFHHLLNLSSGLVDEARHRGAATVMTLHDYWLTCPRDGLRMQRDATLCRQVDHEVCARCMARSPYLVPPLQRGLTQVARRAGMASALHLLNDAAPRLTERLLGLARSLSPGPGGLAPSLGRRAARLRDVANSVDAVIAPTGFVRDRALEFGVRSERLRTLALGAIEGSIRPRRAGARPRLGYVGTLAPHKGVHVLLEAFRGVTAREATLDIHGSLTVEPSYADTLRRSTRGDPRIRFRGPFTEGQQEHVLSELDALVLPSIWWENSPLTALEALASGRPVIASATGGVPEIVTHGESGWLVAPGDVEALREAMQGVAEGRLLGGAAPALPLKTASQGAGELAQVYADLRR